MGMAKKQMGERVQVALKRIAARGKDGSTALEIGDAISRQWGRTRRRKMSKTHKEVLGSATATRLTEAGVVVATRYNKFILARHKSKRVPPAVEVESDGIRRRPSYARETGTFGAASGVRSVDKDAWMREHGWGR